MPIWNVMTPRAAISARPAVGPNAGAGTASSAGYLPGALGLHRMP